MANLDLRLIASAAAPEVAASTVAIVGGGYAGMAAAVTLADEGIASTVFEAGVCLGGRARQIEYRSEVLDNGQHILAGAYTELLRLMRLVGVPEAAFQRVPLCLSMPPNFLLRASTSPWLPGPLYLAWTLLTAQGLSFSDKFAAIRFMQTLKRAKFKVDANISVAALLAAHRQSKNLIDHLWQPLTISALNTPLATASAQIFANVLRDSLASCPEASDLLLPRVDLTALFPQPAAAWLAERGGETLLGTRVREILPQARQYEVCCDHYCRPFDSVILAVGPQQLDGLLPGVSSPALGYEPITTIYFKFARSVRLPEPMLGQLNGLAQWFFDRNALAHDQSESGLIAAVISASGPHQLLSQEILVERVLIELQQHVSDLPAPIWHKTITEKFATFACTPTAARPGTTTPHAGVFRAGDYVAGDYPATLEGAVRNGISAAQASLAYLKLAAKKLKQ